MNKSALNIRALSTDNRVRLKELAEFALKHDTGAFSLRTRHYSGRTNVSPHLFTQYLMRDDKEHIVGAYDEERSALIGSLVARAIPREQLHLKGHQVFEMQAFATDDEAQSEKRAYVIDSLLASLRNYRRKETRGLKNSLLCIRSSRDCSELVNKWFELKPLTHSLTNSEPTSPTLFWIPPIGTAGDEAERLFKEITSSLPLTNSNRSDKKSDNGIPTIQKSPYGDTTQDKTHSLWT